MFFTIKGGARRGKGLRGPSALKENTRTEMRFAFPLDSLQKEKPDLLSILQLIKKIGAST